MPCPGLPVQILTPVLLGVPYSGLVVRSLPGPYGDGNVPPYLMAFHNTMVCPAI